MPGRSRETIAENGSVPALSVVVPTTSTWDAIEPVVRQLLTSLNPIDGELVLASGVGEPPAIPSGLDRIRILHLAGADVFALRAAGIAAAQGTIIAVTEDHCQLPDDWCTRIRDQFTADPALEVLGGAVVNGSEASVMDRANFCMTFARLSPRALHALTPCISNVAVRRCVLPAAPEPGWFELSFLPASTQSVKTVMCSELVVTHVQSHGFLRTPLVHFHNGRVTGAYRVKFKTLLGRGGPFRIANREMRSHLRATRKALQAAGEEPHVLILVQLLAHAHAIGCVVGAHWGPGESARHLV